MYSRLAFEQTIFYFLSLADKLALRGCQHGKADVLPACIRPVFKFGAADKN